MILPDWAQSQLFLIMISIIACLLIVLPLLTRSLILRVYVREKTALADQNKQEQQTRLNEISLLNLKLHQAEQNYQALSVNSLQDKRSLQSHSQVLQQTVSHQERRIGQLSQQSTELQTLKYTHEVLQEKYTTAQQLLSELQAKYQSQQAAIEQERKAFDEKFVLLKDAEAQLNAQFENLANKIFEQKAEKFTKTSEVGLNHLLSPLKLQIDEFKKQITDQYVKEGQERASLKTEILSLKALNQQITQEAAALTNALKGDNKQQGNWGEVILSKILDESGLREGHEYETQKKLSNQYGRTYRPDIVVHLPNAKDIVIDSKVSLVAHEKVMNAETEEARKLALKSHVASVKGHIKGLSRKDYQDLNGVKTLDYVLMFIPIESAFMNAIQHEPELVKLALDNQIMLVSPTNLLVALRTINNIWQYEYQNQHAKTIADKAKNMYDKFAGFVEDMQRMGKNMDTLQNSYDLAMNKLSSGRGNLISQAESFKKLGVIPTKTIDKELLNDDE